MQAVHSYRKILIAIILAQSITLGRFASAAQRRIAVGDDMPEFTAPTAAGPAFEYKHGRGKPLLMIFLSAYQERSWRAAADIKKILDAVSPNSTDFDAVAVTAYPAADDPPANLKQITVHGFPLLPDPEYRLWGKFGIIATPTVIISGPDDKVLWVEAGYGYDFAAMVQARLRQALGLQDKTDADRASQVRTLDNNTVDDRVQRHLRMAQLLKEKGHDASAVRELEKALSIDPNSIEAALEVARMYCRLGRTQAALKTLDALDAPNKTQKAALALIRGWANRQAKDLDAAEKNLLQALEYDPTSPEAMFQLGRVYHEKGDFEKAAACYRKALAAIYGEK